MSMFGLLSKLFEGRWLTERLSLAICCWMASCLMEAELSRHQSYSQRQQQRPRITRVRMDRHSTTLATNTWLKVSIMLLCMHCVHIGLIYHFYASKGKFAYLF